MSKFLLQLLAPPGGTFLRSLPYPVSVPLEQLSRVSMRSLYSNAQVCGRLKARPRIPHWNSKQQEIRVHKANCCLSERGAAECRDGGFGRGRECSKKKNHVCEMQSRSGPQRTIYYLRRPSLSKRIRGASDLRDDDFLASYTLQQNSGAVRIGKYIYRSPAGCRRVFQECRTHENIDLGELHTLRSGSIG